VTSAHTKASEHYHSTLDITVGDGAYGSPLINTVCGTYCGGGFKVDEDTYILDFQCRVIPDKIKICSDK
jgi:hypothetical protein